MVKEIQEYPRYSNSIASYIYNENNFNKAGYDGLLNNGRPLNILRRIISILGSYISREAIKDLDNIKKNLDKKRCFHLGN